MSADKFKLKRGTTAQVNAYLPQQGEPVVDLTTMSLKIGDGLTLGGVSLSLVASAVKLATSRSIGLTGAVTGTVSFDGSSNVSITTSVGASLQASLDAKAPLASPALTGVPTAPTAAAGTNTTQLATTAFVEAARVILAAADALKAPLASPALTGTPTAPTAAAGTNTTQLATTAMVQAEIANKRAWTSYTPTVTATTGAFTSISATGKYMVAFGICNVQITVTITTIGTGTYPIVTLPFPALAGSAGHTIMAKAGAVNSNYGGARIVGTLLAVAPSRYDNLDFTAAGETIYISGSYPIA